MLLSAGILSICGIFGMVPLANKCRTAGRLVGGKCLFGFRIARVKGTGLAPALPHGSILLFRRRKGVARGDIVLVDHPEFGRIVGKISTVGRKGNVYLQGMPRDEASEGQRGKVARDLVRGVKIGKLF